MTTTSLNASPCLKEKTPSQPPPVAAVSEFHGVDVIKECQLQYLQLIWRRVVDKFARIQVESISSIEEEVVMILGEMKRMNSIDLSPLEALLNDLFGKAREYDSSRSSTCDMMTKEARFESLAKAKLQLRDIGAKERATTSQVQDLHTELKAIGDKKKELLTLLDNLEKREQEVQTCIQQGKEELKKTQANLSFKKEEFLSLRVLLSNLMKP